MFTASTTHFHSLVVSLMYHQCIRDGCHGIDDLQRAELIEA